MNIENFTFTKAERKKAKLKLNLSGPSGSARLTAHYFWVVVWVSGSR